MIHSHETTHRPDADRAAPIPGAIGVQHPAGDPTSSVNLGRDKAMNTHLMLWLQAHLAFWLVDRLRILQCERRLRENDQAAHVTGVWSLLGKSTFCSIGHARSFIN